MALNPMYEGMDTTAESGVLGSGSFFNYQPPKESPAVRLNRMKAQARLASEREKRAIDAVGQPSVEADIMERTKAEHDTLTKLEAAVERARSALNEDAPVPGQAQLNTADLGALGLTSLFGGAQAGAQGYQSLMAGAKERQGIQNEAQQRHHERAQQLAMLDFRHLAELAQQSNSELSDLAKTALSIRLESERYNRAQADSQRDAELKFGQQKELLGMKGDQGETSAAYKAYYNAPDLTVRRKAWEFLATRGEFLPEPTEQTGKELLTGSQKESLDTRTDRTKQLLPGEVRAQDDKHQKVQADVQRTLGAIQLDDARKQQILQRVQYYPLEYQNKAANILSQIEKRKQSPMSEKAKNVSVTDIERLRKIVQSRIDTVKANPAQALDPNVAQTMVRDLAELDRLNQLREEVLNAKVYGDVGGLPPAQVTLPPGAIPGVPDKALNTGDPKTMQDRGNASVERDQKTKKKKVSKESLMRQYGF